MNIYNSRLNSQTQNFGGLEWIIDGERGRASYPGTLPECLARRLYRDGLSAVPGVGYCDGCTGSEDTHDCTRQPRKDPK